VFTTARHWPLSWHRLIQSTPSGPVSLRCILILSCHLLLRPPVGVFPSGFRTVILYTFPLPSHTRYTPRPSHPPWFDHTNNTRLRVQIIELLITQVISSLLSLPSTLFSNTLYCAPAKITSLKGVTHATVNCGAVTWLWVRTRRTLAASAGESALLSGNKRE
jgi:hypothetical protein